MDKKPIDDGPAGSLYGNYMRTRNKMRAANYGRWLTAEDREKLKAMPAVKQANVR